MASSPITSLQIAMETMETVTKFIFLGSKITEDGDCSHANKQTNKQKGFALGREAMTNVSSFSHSVVSNSL